MEASFRTFFTCDDDDDYDDDDDDDDDDDINLRSGYVRQFFTFNL